MKHLIILAFLLIFAASLAWSSGQKEAAGKAVEKQTLTIGARAWVYTKFDTKNAGEKFMSDHPAIKVKFITTPDEFVPTYLVDWKTDNPETDMHLGGIANKLGGLEVAGVLLDLTDTMTGNMAKEKFASAFLKNCRFEKAGKPYYPIIPFMGEITVIDVNLKLYREAGMMKNETEAVGPPSWVKAEMKAYFKKLAAVSPQGHALGLPMQANVPNIYHGYLLPILSQRGSIYAPGQDQLLDFESDAAINALTIFSELYKEGILFPNVSKFAETLTAYKGGTLPALQESHSKMVETAGVLGEDNVSFIMWPGYEKHGTVAFTGGTVIAKNSNHIEAAKMFIREQLITKDFDQWSFNRYGKLPVLKESYTSPGLTWFQDQAKRIVEIADKSTVEPIYPDDVELRRMMGEYIHPAVMGDMKPAEALRKLREQIKGQNLNLKRMEIQ